jgi:glycosyltransferase involved in cell wall biosynthesis
MTTPSASEIALVLKGYPRLSEAFIAQEILGLQRAGLPLRLYSLRHPTDPDVHPVHKEITAPVTYLPEYLKDEPARALRGWRAARRLPGYRQAWRAFLGDLRRDRTENRMRRFGQACVLAHELPPTIARIHAHFLHTPASVARYAAIMRGLPWSASAHAKDIWTTPDWEIAEKIADLDWLVTCTEAGAGRLRALAGAPEREKVSLVYHGLDFDRFPKGPRSTEDARDGSDANRPVRLLSVGRAVEKKGYDDLLAALAALPPTLCWHLTHIGGGVLAAELKDQAAALGLSARISWLGPQAQQRVLEAYRQADLFVLASRIGSDGDRDGLPNVLMEAQSQGLCCLSTKVSAIPELILQDRTGALVEGGDRAALTTALAEMIADPDKRQRLGEAGYERLRDRFSMDTGLKLLLERFDTVSRRHAAE